MTIKSELLQSITPPLLVLENFKHQIENLHTLRILIIALLIGGCQLENAAQNCLIIPDSHQASGSSTAANLEQHITSHFPTSISLNIENTRQPVFSFLLAGNPIPWHDIMLVEGFPNKGVPKNFEVTCHTKGTMSFIDIFAVGANSQSGGRDHIVTAVYDQGDLYAEFNNAFVLSAVGQ